MGRVIGLIIKESPKFVCPECGKEYKTESGLAQHIEKEHGEDKNGENP